MLVGPIKSIPSRLLHLYLLQYGITDLTQRIIPNRIRLKFKLLLSSDEIRSLQTIKNERLSSSRPTPNRSHLLNRKCEAKNQESLIPNP